MKNKIQHGWSYGLVASLALLAPFDLLASLGMDIYLPVVPEMPAALDTSPTVIQFTLTLYMLMLGIGQILFGPLSDRIGRRPIMLAGATLFALSSFGLGLVNSAWPFLTIRVLQALGASAVTVAIFATIRDVFSNRSENAIIYGLMGGILSFVPAIGPILGSLLARASNWRAIFIALGAAALVALVATALTWPETMAKRDVSAAGGYLTVLRSRDFRVYTVAYGAAMGSFFVFFSTAPRVLIDKADMSEFAFSLSFAAVAGVLLATSPFAKKFVSAWGTRGTVKRGMTLLLFGTVLLICGQLLMEPSIWSFVLPMCFIAIGITMTSSVSANGALHQFDDIAGTATALYFCVQSLLVAILGTLFVVLLNGGTAWPLIGYTLVTATVTLVGLRTVYE